MEKSTINRYITIDYNTIVTKNIEYAIVKSEIVNLLTMYSSINQSQCGVNINELYKLMNYFTPNNIDKILSALIKDNIIYKEYTNVIIGDINGDGVINSADLLKIRQHLLGINKLNGPYFLSSDINYDNTINSADLLKIRQHLLNVKRIDGGK